MEQATNKAQYDGVQPIKLTTDVKFLRGSDGFSPTVDFEELDGGFYLIVEDREGTERFFVPTEVELTDEQVEPAIVSYFEKNPIKESDPTVPAWAKEASKPTYTAEEVGALPDSTVIPIVPDNVSAFNNDAGYLIEIPSEYVTESELSAKGYQTASQVSELIDSALGVIENGAY